MCNVIKFGTYRCVRGYASGWRRWTLRSGRCITQKPCRECSLAFLKMAYKRHLPPWPLRENAINKRAYFKISNSLNDEASYPVTRIWHRQTWLIQIRRCRTYVPAIADVKHEGTFCFPPFLPVMEKLRQTVGPANFRKKVRMVRRISDNRACFDNTTWKLKDIDIITSERVLTVRGEISMCAACRPTCSNGFQSLITLELDNQSIFFVG